MDVPFEVNKDRLIAEINGEKKSENGRSRIECFVINNLSSLITLLVFCVGLRNYKVQKHYLYRNNSLTTEKVNKSMPGQ